MNRPLIYYYRTLLFALGVIEVATVQLYDVTSVEFDGRLYGPGFLLLTPFPEKHLLYVREDAPHYEDLHKAFGDADGSYKQMGKVDALFKQYRGSTGTPCRYYTVRTDYYKPCAAENSVLLQTDCVKVKITFPAAVYSQALAMISTAGIPILRVKPEDATPSK